jgi:hypothetical protein
MGSETDITLTLLVVEKGGITCLCVGDIAPPTTHTLTADAREQLFMSPGGNIAITGAKQTQNSLY